MCDHWFRYSNTDSTCYFQSNTQVLPASALVLPKRGISLVAFLIRCSPWFVLSSSLPKKLIGLQPIRDLLCVKSTIAVCEQLTRYSHCLSNLNSTACITLHTAGRSIPSTRTEKSCAKYRINWTERTKGNVVSLTLINELEAEIWYACRLGQIFLCRHITCKCLQQAFAGNMSAYKNLTARGCLGRSAAPTFYSGTPSLSL